MFNMQPWIDRIGDISEVWVVFSENPLLDTTLGMLVNSKTLAATLIEDDRLARMLADYYVQAGARTMKDSEFNIYRNKAYQEKYGTVVSKNPDPASELKNTVQTRGSDG